MRIYVKNISVSSRSNLKRRSLGLLWGDRLNSKKKNSDMSSGMRSVPDLEHQKNLMPRSELCCHLPIMYCCAALIQFSSIFREATEQSHITRILLFPLLQ